MPVQRDGAEARVASGRLIRHWHYVLLGLDFTIEVPEDSTPPASDDRPNAVRVSSVSIDATQTSTPNAGAAADLVGRGLSHPVPVGLDAHPPPLQSMHGPPLCHTAELLRSGVRLV